MQFNNPSLNRRTKTKNMTTLHLRNSIGPATAGLGFLLIPLVLICFALSPTVQAVSPAPDGGYANANTAEGTAALFSLTSGGGWNTALGFHALYFNTSGSGNTAEGAEALLKNTTGGGNTATGLQALRSNTASLNTAVGYQALTLNTTGSDNAATGFKALLKNTTGKENTANGSQALFSNTTASANTANGFQALFSNTTGDSNTANGYQALYSNTTGNSNNATGSEALFNNTTGVWNEAYGYQALYSNVTGNENTAIGDSAGHNITGSYNICVGSQAGFSLTTGDNNIDIGSDGVAAESDTIRIGTEGTQSATYIAGIDDVVISGDPVCVSSDGQLGECSPSSARFKHDIKPMEKASEVLLSLKPVTFRYNANLDPKEAAQFGLVAEEVEKIAPYLVRYDKSGKINGVRYEAVNAMLLNEFLKEHRKVQKQEATIAQLKSGMEVLTASLKEQAAQIQKVSAQIELSKPAPRTVVNNQ